MKKHKKSMMMFALLFLIGISTAYVASTYAKYTAKVNGSGTATVAKWNFDVENTTKTYDITLTNTVDASTLVSGKIAPGTSGTFNIVLANKTSEVGVDFTIEFTGTENVPNNLVFKAGTSAVNVSSQKITGKIAQNGEITIPVSWEWPYETGSTPYDTEDGEDTTDGKAAKTMTLKTVITGVQTAPSATAITTGYNVE